jgi:hypothetical protein
MTEQPLAVPSFATDGGHALFRWLHEMRDRHSVWLNQMGRYFTVIDPS